MIDETPIQQDEEDLTRRRRRFGVLVLLWVGLGAAAERLRTPSRVVRGSRKPRSGHSRALSPAVGTMAAVGLFVGLLSVGRSDLSHYEIDRPDGFGVPLPAQTRQFSSPGVALRDDDGGQPLFDASNLAPGARIQDCVTVTYTGTEERARLTLAVRAAGALAPMLATTVEAGSGGRFHDCSGFVARQTIFTGSLALLSSVAAPATNAGLGVGDVARGEATTFRFSFVVGDDDAIQGTTAGADFLWGAHA